MSIDFQGFQVSEIVTIVGEDPPVDFQCLIAGGYPLVMTNIAMENHHFQWVNPLFLWPFSIAMLNYQRIQQNHGIWAGLKWFPTLHDGSIQSCR